MSLPHLSRRATQTPPSPIRRLSYLAHAAARQGTKVYHLNIGQPDIATPTEFFEGLNRYHSPVVAYERSQGNESLRQAWSHYLNRELQIALSPDQLMITMGASEALIFLFMSLCDPGDEVIVFDPTYANYIGFAAVAGVRLVAIPTYLEENFSLPASATIEQAITAKTRAILLCSPNNPTGTIYSREELTTLLAICEKNNIFLVVDETYREFVYDSKTPVSLLEIAPNSNRVVVVDSLSKRFSLCGARIGCLITSNQEILTVTLNIAQARLAAPTIEQVAAAYMLEKIGSDYLTQVKAEYENRRNVLFSAISKLPAVTAHKPQGAFYCIVRLDNIDAEAFASYLLTDFSFNGETTFVAPAAGFYMDNTRGFSEIRIAYVLNQQELDRAVYVLGTGLAKFKERN